MAEDKPFDDTTLGKILAAKTSDDAQVSYREMGAMMARYYQGMIEGGLSQELAEEMVLDYHWLFVGGMTFKNGGLPPRSY